MLGIVAYGSLIDPAEAKKQGEAPLHSIPVKATGFRRSFDQKPAWRTASDEGSAVLGVHKSEPDWLNAICYCYNTFDFMALDKRERGYIRTTVPLNTLKCYRGTTLPLLEAVIIYLGRPEYQNLRIFPNQSYLNLCLRGAKNWGNEFYHDFLHTTHINNGVLLDGYLNRKEHG